MHLTRTGMLLGVLTMLVGILGLWSAGPDSVPWWRVLAVILLLSLLAELLITRTRSITARIPQAGGRFFLGRHEQLALEFDNGSARSLQLRFVVTVPAAFDCHQDTLQVALPPRSSSRSELPVRSLILGRHRFETVAARVRGPLGLAWWSRRLPVGQELVVQPDTLGAQGKTAGVERSGANTETAHGGAMELHHLRDYAPGDPLNTIDWKATARSSRLITRVFNEDQHLEVMILLDAGRTGRTQIDEIDQFGHYVNLAARFAEYCVAGDDRVGLVAFTDRTIASLPTGRGTGAVRRLRQTLGDLAPAPIESDVLQAALHLRRLVRHRCLVVILTDLYERSATSQLVQASRLLLPQHLPLIVGITSEDVVRIAAAPAEHRLDPYRSLAAREYQQHVAANVARLMQLGAQALTARPRELDGKVFARYDLLRAQRRI